MSQERIAGSRGFTRLGTKRVVTATLCVAILALISGMEGCLHSPMADFSVDYSTGHAPFTVVFSNESQHASSYVWDFGDGSTSGLASPVHTYSTHGVYHVQLTAYGALGLTDTDSTLITVLPCLDSGQLQ